MGSNLPNFSRPHFTQRLQAVSPWLLPRRVVDRLWAHYEELRRWNVGLSLVGPGSADDIVERHYGEALAALPLLSSGSVELVDLGSGAGFPGFVLAAACDNLRVTLIEAQARKWSFLLAAARRATLPIRCLNATIGSSLPAELPVAIDLLTIRALKISPKLLRGVTSRLSSDGRLLLWVGGDEPRPVGFRRLRELPLPGRLRRIVEYGRD